MVYLIDFEDYADKCRLRERNKCLHHGNSCREKLCPTIGCQLVPPQNGESAPTEKRSTGHSTPNTGSPKLLLRCRDYIAGVSGRSFKGDELLNDLNEQLRADA